MNGTSHKIFNAAWIGPIGYAGWQITGDPLLGICSALGVIAGFSITPDLDIADKSTRGTKRAIWWLYGKLIPHRSVWSHGLLIGTAIRLLWISWPVIALFLWLHWSVPPRALECIAFFSLGLACADAGHAICDLL